MPPTPDLQPGDAVTVMPEPYNGCPGKVLEVDGMPSVPVRVEFTLHGTHHTNWFDYHELVRIGDVTPDVTDPDPSSGLK